MSLVNIGRLELETVVQGKPDAPAILLIQGLGTPLTRWPASLTGTLVEAGFRVIAFDNRDAGLSTRMEALGLPDVKRLMSVKPFSWALPLVRPTLPVPYTLADMAADAAALLDALHIEAAHIVGASLGGMIAQLFAAYYPERCLSLTSMMSSSGNPLLPPPSSVALHALFAPLPAARDVDTLIEDCIWRQKVLMSPGYPASDEALRAMFTADYRRSGFYSKGVLRQLATLLTAGDRRSLLATIRVPAMVLHGADDPLINPACGLDTASSIPGAEFRTIPGMAHDFPEALGPEFATGILTAARRAAKG
ncbi:MAG: alpha/beta fold hydrolase [Azoarcus sp.]|jgi:pimeloyl-ACP methyl ester carboxylesterase|nr:alpha/beta fold hydrolase [Azoarcus sp.]